MIETIEHLQHCLSAFHDHKAVFLNLGAQENFNLPKLHSLTYYALLIQLFGMTDNYNIEQSKHLHIDLAKDVYCATNCKNKYSQMILWLEHQEKMQHHTASIDRKQEVL
jgi:hypothetical protein